MSGLNLRNRTTRSLYLSTNSSVGSSKIPCSQCPSQWFSFIMAMIGTSISVSIILPSDESACTSLPSAGCAPRSMSNDPDQFLRPTNGAP